MSTRVAALGTGQQGAALPTPPQLDLEAEQPHREAQEGGGDERQDHQRHLPELGRWGIDWHRFVEKRYANPCRTARCNPANSCATTDRGRVREDQEGVGRRKTRAGATDWATTKMATTAR